MAAKNKFMTNEVKAFVVRALASFDTPTQVVAAVKDEYGLQMTPQAVQAYDPTKYAGRHLAPKWKAMFEKARKSFIDDASDIPIANRSTRLRALQRMASKAENMGNMGMASKLLEQAAKEMGNAFTNKVDLTSSDGSMTPKGLGDFYGRPGAPQGGE